MFKSAASAILMCLAAAQGAPKPQQVKLSVVNAVLHDRREGGPSIPQGYEYVSGELMYFSFRIGGYQVRDDKVDLRWLIYASDPEGVLLWEPFNGAVREEVTHNDENWLPRVQQTLPLPPQLPPGEYKMLIRIADELAKTQAEQEVRFRVRGRPIPRPDTFTILNPRFYRGEQDPAPMAEGVYGPGDALWMRFELAGFRIAEKNRFDVEYGLRVLRPSGKEMYAEPKAAAEQDSPYYPKRVMHGAINLNLSADLTPGVYTIVVAGRDNIGQANAEVSIPFTVAK